ncbi:hypothetical protein GCM10027416_16970 [Okibacterium endophyticum]
MRQVNGTDVVVRPLPALLWQGALGMALLGIPIIVTGLLHTIPDGQWQFVAIFCVVFAVAVAVMVTLFVQERITATDDTLIERTMIGRTIVVPKSEIERVVLLELHRSMANDSRLQLFVLGKGNKWLLRMRGEYWSREDIENIASRISIPIERQSKPVTLNELQMTSPEMLYWFERAPKLPRRT